MKTTQRNQISLGELVTVGVTLVVVGLIFAFGTDIVVDVRDDFAATEPAFIPANDTVRSFGEITTKLPTIALIIAVAVIIGVLVRSFMKTR